MSDKEKELREAAADGRLADVKRLVEEEGVNPNCDNGRALCRAARNGQTNVVDYLLKKNVSTECRWGGATPLIHAAFYNYLEVVRLLLAANANINARTNSNKTALDYAVEKKHDAIAQLLRDHPQRKINKDKLLAALHERRIQDAIHLISETNIDVNLRDGNFVPLLHLVTETGNMELLQTLLSKPNLSVNATDKEEQTALARAIGKNDVAVVFALLQANATVNQLNEAQLRALIAADLFGNALFSAASTNDASSAERLLLAGVRPAMTNEDGATALHVAAANGFDAIAALLLAEDPSLSLRSDRRGNLPLHLAAANGHLTIVKLLLNNSTYSGLNCTNNSGEVPLLVAVKAGHANIVERLLLAKASSSCLPHEGQTLLHVAAAQGNLGVVKVLVTAGFNVFATDMETGRTALHMAAAANHGKVVARLVAAGATIDVAARTVNGWTALVVATARQHVDIVGQLLRAGASVHVNANATKSTKTLYQPLHLAAEHGYGEIVSLLLAHNANVNAGSMRPLHLAVRHNPADVENDHADVVRRLLDADASLSVTNLAGKTPRMLAKALKHTLILSILTRHALFVAVRDHDVDGFVQLLDGDVDDMRNNVGTPLLHVLVEQNCTEMLQALLAKSVRGIDIEYEGHTPLDRAIGKKNAAMALALVLANATCKHLSASTVAAFLRSPDAFVFNAQLLRAASTGDTGVVTKLLAMGVRATARDETLRTALHVAATHGHDAMVSLLLEKEALLGRCRDEEGNLPLHNAAASGHVTLIDHLVAPLTINEANAMGNLPLHNAAASGHVALVDQLAAALTINEANDDGWTPLGLAVQSGRTNVVKQLLHHRVSLEHKSGKDGTLLHVATSSCVSTDLLEHLVKSGSDVNACDTRGWTPLHIVADKGHLQAVEYLVRAGANVVAKTQDCKTPLQMAKDTKVVKALLKAEADARTQAHVLKQHANDQTASLCRAVLENDVAAVTDLLAAGVKPSGLTVEGVPLPVVAMRRGHWETCDRLLAVSVVPSDAARVRMMHSLALELEQFQAAWHILQANSDVLARDTQHVSAEANNAPVHALQAMWTGAALRTAARDGQVDVAKHLLLQFQGIVDATNERGETPLHVAVASANVSSDVAAYTAMTTLLLKYRANPLAINTMGVTPLLLAARSGKSNVTAALVAAVLAKPSPDTAALATCFAEAVRQRDVQVVAMLLPKMPTDVVTLTLASNSMGLAILAATVGHLATLDGRTAKDMATGDVTPRLTTFLVDVAEELELVQRRIQEDDLVKAVDSHDWPLVKTLLIKGVVITDAGVMDTIWKEAVSADDEKLIETLCGAPGIDTSLRNQAGRSALEAAMDANKLSVVSSILDAFAATNSDVAPEALLPWHIAVERNSSVMLGVLFTRTIYSVNSTDANGWTPVALAIQNNEKTMVEMLVSCKADISIAPTNMNPPLHMALSQPDSSGILRVVLRKGVTGLDVEQRNTANHTALRCAVVDGREEAVKLLLEAGANVMQSLPDNGPTILAAAAQRPNRAITTMIDNTVGAALSKIWAADIGFGDLQVGDILGSGAYGTVYRATYKNHSIALKTCSMNNIRAYNSFRDEIEIARPMRSPYLVRLLTVVDDQNGKPHMVLELMDAGDLFDYIANKRSGKPVKKNFSIVQVAWAVANALAYIHGAGLIHRDVKSLNIFLCTTNGVKLGDFNTLRIVNEKMTNNVGTPETMAPEVTRRGSESECAYNALADMYSFGVVLAQLTWIRTPCDSPLDTENTSRNGSVTPAIKPNCAMWLETLATRCLAVDPTARPSATQVVEILATHLEDTDDQVTLEPSPEVTP
ncbi:TKL protein kinase [Saprolegnia parasitica CBS 223.65]|uniref:TKL protein kinase n=1 Tax=Saprolegnia parasitica (strain CBS 223.65) TaxID=695850 RepID=A0A067BUP7_SAPPC|nr:TKL protein kinase [Saprolegnia parasitica CBS 223.65]KDO22003.1 TKL protein kinase [Saprolegnia parasitica CBS 223.65]|eukprot:XP_012207290.1 TKL protein kinase [Saprolegnia parasitica CBS 223.65]